MTIRALFAPEQNSAYGAATYPLHPWLDSRVCRMIPPTKCSFHRGAMNRKTKPYPPHWDKVADLRVFRTTPKEWQKLIGWRSEMKSKGWRLLQVSTVENDLVAVFGRTKAELLSHGGGGR